MVGAFKLASKVPTLAKALGPLGGGLSVGLVANGTITASARRIEQFADEGNFDDTGTAVAIAIGDAMGFTDLVEGIYGYEILTGRRLDDEEAGTKLGTGGGAQVLNVAPLLIGGIPKVKTVSRSLLAGELRVARFGDVKMLPAGDNLTPHHGPSAKWLRKRLGMARDDGIAIMLEHYYPSNTGRHSRTRTFGSKGRNEELLRENFRTALGRDVRDVRRILIEDQVYDARARAALHEWIREWRLLNQRRMATGEANLFERTDR